MPITERRLGSGRVPLRIILPQRTPDILDSDKASQFQGALAVMAVAERYMAQEGEQYFSLNLEFFSIWGKVTSFLPPYRENDEQSKVYVFNYQRAKEKALKDFIWGGEDISARTETPQDVMLKIWIEQNIPDRGKFLEINPVDVRKPFIKIDLRKDVSRRLLQASHGKFFSLHPELREGMITQEEWQRQEESKKEERFKPVAPVKHAEVPVLKPAEKEPEEILKLEPVQIEMMKWMVKLFREGRKNELGDIKAARIDALSKGFPVFYSRVEEITALFRKEILETVGKDLTLEEFRALKAVITKIDEEAKKEHSIEQRRAKREKSAV